MSRMNKGRLRQRSAHRHGAWALLALCLVVGSLAAQGRQPVATEHLGPGSVVWWQPKGDYERLVLTVSGPGEIDLRHVFEHGVAPSFQAVDHSGNPLPDGSYVYELSAVPNIEPAVRELLLAARESGEDRPVAQHLRATGVLPTGDFVQSGHFRMLDGGLVTAGIAEPSHASSAGDQDPGGTSDPGSQDDPAGSGLHAGDHDTVFASGGAYTGAAGSHAGGSASAGPGETDGSKRVTTQGPAPVIPDQVFLDDLIIDGSACFGLDCVNGYSFGFDTVVLTENNLRIAFKDTSNTSQFPSNDWGLQANDSANGGGNYFSIVDRDANNHVFKVEAGAPHNALYVDDNGDVGVGTATPVLEMHVSDGDTPGTRLEQNGSQGWPPQTWDVAGNETSFFIRDVSNGSTLPFRIKPGASSNSLVVESDSSVEVNQGNLLVPTTNVGIGTVAPTERLHVSGDDGTTVALIEETDPTVVIRNLLALNNTGGVSMIMTNTDSGNFWQMQHLTGGNFRLSMNAGGNQFVLDGAGNLDITGTLTQMSDVNAKRDFESVDGRAVLEQLVEVPITRWSYKADEDHADDGEHAPRHMGPMAQDFHASFGLGADERGISSLDANGVTIAAVQGLYEVVQEKDARIQALEARLVALEAALTDSAQR